VDSAVGYVYAYPQEDISSLGDLCDDSCSLTALATDNGAVSGEKQL
jgi:hypothetical protein